MGKAQFWMQIALAIVFVLFAIVETAIGNTPWGAVFGALAILTAVVTVFRFKRTAAPRRSEGFVGVDVARVDDFDDRTLRR